MDACTCVSQMNLISRCSTLSLVVSASFWFVPTIDWRIFSRFPRKEGPFMWASFHIFFFPGLECNVLHIVSKKESPGYKRIEPEDLVPSERLIMLGADKPRTSTIRLGTKRFKLSQIEIPALCTTILLIFYNLSYFQTGLFQWKRKWEDFRGVRARHQITREIKMEVFFQILTRMYPGWTLHFQALLQKEFVADDVKTQIWAAQS